MPTIRVELFEGRTPEQKKDFAVAVTEVAARTLGAKPESVDVIFVDVKKTEWATGGVFWSERTQ
ncbi:MAG: 4-oxalocrotonate tautomerase [Serpentinimonas sp.]|jgi:4-oxalocrotonate tautomerase|nr:4-oxalocrotonate tautomerase [Serpentinimonas sp.]